MSWFTENPWPLVLVFGGAAVVMLIVGESRGRAVAVVFFAAAAGVYCLESAIVTPAEQVEQGLQTLLAAFIAEDIESINAQIADAAPGLREQAKQGLELVRVGSGFHLRDVVVNVSGDGQSAEAELRANGALTLRQSQTSHHAATRWRTEWTMSGGVWKLANVHRLNPLTGEEIGVLDRQ